MVFLPRCVIKLQEASILLLYRENTEGEYAPIGGRLYPGTENETAIQTSVFTRKGCQRIMRAAFHAARHTPKKLTSITKSNAQVHSLGLWDDCFKEVSKTSRSKGLLLVDVYCVGISSKLSI